MKDTKGKATLNLLLKVHSGNTDFGSHLHKSVPSALGVLVCDRPHHTLPCHDKVLLVLHDLTFQAVSDLQPSRLVDPSVAGAAMKDLAPSHTEPNTDAVKRASAAEVALEAGPKPVKKPHPSLVNQYRLGLRSQHLDLRPP